MLRKLVTVVEQIKFAFPLVLESRFYLYLKLVFLLVVTDPGDVVCG